MNEKLEVVISADISALSKELQAANKLLQQHERNYKGVQSAIGQNTVKTQQLEGELKRLNSQFNSGSISQSRFTKETDRLTTELREVSQSTTGYQKELKRLDTEIKRANASNAAFSGKVGQTGAAASNAAAGVNKLGNSARMNAVPAMTSFSQIIQDAPYGIQGVANNIQQLTMQMGYLSNKAGGTGGALKAMVGTLMGPTGILLAVSVVTSALVAYGDKLFNAKSETEKLREETEKAREELDRFTNSLNNLQKVELTSGITVDKELAELRQLERQMVDGSRTAKERQDAYDELNRKYPQTLANYSKEILMAEGLGKAYDEIAKSAKARSQSEEAQKKINDNIQFRNELLTKEGTLIDKITEKKKEIIKNEETALELAKKNLAGSDVAAAKASKAQSELNKLLEEQQGIKADISQLEKDNINLSNKITFVPNEIAVDTSKAKLSDPEGMRVPVQSVMMTEPTGLGKSLDATREFNAELVRQIELMKILQGGLTVGSAAYNQFGEVIDHLKDRLSGGFDAMNQGAKEATDKFAATFAERNENIKLLDQMFLSEQMMMAAQMSQVFGSIATNLVDSMLEGKLSVKDFVTFVMKSFSQLMIQLAQQAIAEKIMSKAGLATDQATAQGNAAVVATNAAAAAGPFGAALLPGLLASMSGIVGGFFAGLQGFNTGGMVGGNSYSGDKILARLNSGEGVLTAQGVRNAGNLLTPNSNAGAMGALQIVGESVITGEQINTVWRRYNQSNGRVS